MEVGSRLGPHSVTGKIGEGGMGEVAIKVLPQAFTDDPDRLAQFERL